MTKIGLYDIANSTTPESNKSLIINGGVLYDAGVESTFRISCPAWQSHG
jgi:hypothetical protein